MFLWNELLDMEESFLEASFQFCISGHSYEPIYHVDPDHDSIIMCGVHPIFREDRLSRDKKRSRIEEDKEDEPSLSRLILVMKLLSIQRLHCKNSQTYGNRQSNTSY